MKDKFSLTHSLDLLTVVLTLAALAAVIEAFVIGKHYVIPTGILTFAVLFGNLARFGLAGYRWAKQFLFWMYFLFACHAFFALFWAAKPREIFGAAFPYLYGGVLLLLIVLLIPYAKRNAIFAARVD